MTIALCVDLGGTNFRAALAKAHRPGDAEALGHWPAPADLSSFRRTLDALIASSGAVRLGVAIPGLTDSGRCLWVPNLPFFDGEDISHMFSGVSVVIGNDARLALLAEAALGAARDVADALLVAVGTGIGSAVLADGRILRGAGSAASSFGWACADPADPGDAAHGWLERNASGTALDAIARELGRGDGRALIVAARAGDPKALAALKAPAEALAAALAGVVATLGSRRVVISGGVAEGLDALQPLILSALRRQLPPHLRAVELRSAEFGARASLIGAGLAALGSAMWTER
jgi:glucokinase